MIDFISTPVATVLRAIHAMFSTFLDPASGLAWGLSIVVLTIVVRLLLFPLFVKQIKSQRRMAELAPKMNELKIRHKGDRETLNTEVMKLYKENNVNPIGCGLPILLQMPVFFALFSVMNEFRPGKDARFGLSAELLAEGGRAQVFGAPIASAFTSSADLLDKLGGDQTTVKLVAATMVALMAVSTFWTQRQMMLRGGPVTDPQQQMVQKLMLYVLPFTFAISGFIFPIGVLLYMVTTNLWSMGQQHWVIKRMPPVVGVPALAGKTASGKPGAAKAASGKAGSKTVNGKAVSGQPMNGAAVNATAGGEGRAAGAMSLDATGPVAVGAATGVKRPAGSPGARRAAGSRKNKKRGRR